MKSPRVLIIDDETVICNACHLILTETGWNVQRQKTGTSGLMALDRGAFDVVLLDLKLPDMDGMDILKTIKREKPDTRVIVMTGYSTINIAVQAMKFGAVDYLSKPFTDDELIQVVSKAHQTAPGGQQ